MGWWNELDNSRGSQPRCILLVDGTRKEVAERLTELVDFPGVTVSRDDKWKPYGKLVQNKKPSKEAKLDEPNLLEDKLDLLKRSRLKLKSWWREAPRGGSSPNWDIASTCTIQGRQGLLLVEAKAHGNELDKRGKSKKRSMSNDSVKNHKRIGEAIIEANDGFKQVATGSWNLSRDSHYQLSNRFAWAWKLATLNIPVVLVYLGFLNAEDMACDGPLFSTEVDWEKALKKYCDGIVDNSCWGGRLDIAGTPLIPLIRVFEQPFAGP